MPRSRKKHSEVVRAAPSLLSTTFPQEFAAWGLARGLHRLRRLLQQAAYFAEVDSPLSAEFSTIRSAAIELVPDVVQRAELVRRLLDLAERVQSWLIDEERGIELDAFELALAQVDLNRDDGWPAALQEASVVPVVFIRELDGLVQAVAGATGARNRAVFWIAEHVASAASFPTGPSQWSAVCERAATVRGEFTPPAPQSLEIGGRWPTVDVENRLRERLSCLQAACQAVPRLERAWYEELVRRWHDDALPHSDPPTWEASFATAKYLDRVAEAFWLRQSETSQRPVEVVVIYEKAPYVRIGDTLVPLEERHACYLRIVAHSDRRITTKAIRTQMKKLDQDTNMTRVFKSLPTNVRPLVDRNADGAILRCLVKFEDAPSLPSNAGA